MKDFIIDSMAWYQDMKLHHDVRLSFFVIASFLQENGLTNKRLINSITDIDDDFNIQSSDLTEEGLSFMKACYSKWVRGIDKGKSPEDTRALVQCLKKLRG